MAVFDENKEEKRDEAGRFIVGTAKIGGRKPGIRNWNARRVAESLGLNPLHVGIMMLKTGYMPLAKGEKPEEQRKLSPELYAKVWSEMMGYCAAKLSAVQLTGADEGPLAIATLDVTQLMKNPELVAAAQTLALGITAATVDKPREPEMLDGETEDIDPTPPQETTDEVIK